MVLAFFKSTDDGNFDHIVSSAVAMLADARHSFDLATLAVLTDADPAAVADDVRKTDQRINLAEQELRSELIVHVSVQGTADIGSVLGFTLLLKKIERIGDQAKNILDLAENGVTLADRSDIDDLLAGRQVLSGLFGEAGVLLSDPDPSDEAISEYADRAVAAMHEYQATIDACMTSDLPGREVVPLAIYFRYLRRVAANLVGVVRSSSEPIPTVDYLEGGTVDTED